MSIETEFAGIKWNLLPQRALWRRDNQTLIMADIHLGKGAAFRAAGVPVPAGSTAKDLERLSELLRKTDSKRLIILGDFFHAKSGRPDEILDAIGSWRHSHASVQMLLVRGNHDRSAGRVLPEWDITEIDGSFEEDGVIFSHAPLTNAAKPVLAGHVHPVFALRDYDRTMVKTPCFVFDQRCAVLPSFGSFTGGYRIDPQPDRRIYIIAGSRVVGIAAEGNS